jgi:O-antigen/teichoic acid export membrane protein
VVRNALTSYALRGLVGLSALALTPYLFRRLGDAGFGTWSVMLTLTTVYTVVTFGYVSAGGKLVAELRGKGDEAGLAVLARTATGLMLLAGLAALGLALLLAAFASGLAADGQEEEFALGMAILGASMLLYFPGTAWGATLVGYGRYDRYNASEAVAVTVFTAGTVIALEAGGDVLSVAIAQAAGYAAGGLTALVLLRRTDPALPLRPALADREVRREVAGFGSLTVIAEAALFVSLRMDTVVIAALRSAAAAAPFAAALKLQSGLQALTLPFLLLLLPHAAELWALGERESVRERLVLSTRAALQITLPLAVGLALFAPELVDAWLGDEAPDVTDAIVVVLMAIQTVTLTVVAAEKVLIAVGRAKQIALLAVIEAVANLGLSIVLVSEFGAIGAALGTLFTTAVLAPVRFPLVSRAVEIPVSRLLGGGVAKAVVSSLPALAVMVAAWALLDDDLARVLVGLGGGLALAVAVGLHQIGTERIRGAIADLRAGRADPEIGDDAEGRAGT